MWPPSCQSLHFPSSSLLKGIFQGNSIDSSFMPTLIYISPLHLSCGACWNKPLIIFKGQTSAQGFIWHLLAAELLVYCAAPWLEMLLELGWLLPNVRQEGNGCWMGTCTAQGFRAPTPQWQQGNVDVCTKPEAGDWQVMGVNISWKHTASSRDKFPYWWVYYLWSPRENQQLHLINTPSDFCLFGGFILLFIFLD